MKRFSFSLGKLAITTLLLFAALAFAPAAPANPGKVTNVNQGAHTFTVQWTVHSVSHHGMAERYGGSSRERTFKTTDKTTYWVGGTKGAWSDVQKGVLVNVVSHAQGADRVADKVEITKSS